MKLFLTIFFDNYFTSFSNDNLEMENSSDRSVEKDLVGLLLTQAV